MTVRRICWRIVLSGSSYVDIDDKGLRSETLERHLYDEAARRLGDIINHEGMPDWTDMETEVTSVDDVEPDDPSSGDAEENPT